MDLWCNIWGSYRTSIVEDLRYSWTVRRIWEWSFWLRGWKMGKWVMVSKTGICLYRVRFFQSNLGEKEIIALEEEISAFYKELGI